MHSAMTGIYVVSFEMACLAPSSWCNSIVGALPTTRVRIMNAWNKETGIHILFADELPELVLDLAFVIAMLLLARA